MEKILFITSRNIISTSGEFRLINNRSKALYETYDLQTDYICISDKNKFSQKREHLSHVENFKAVTYTKKNPFSVIYSLFKMRKEIKNTINNNNYEAIIVSGVIAMLYTRLLYNNPNKKYILTADIHGALEEFIEFNSKGVIFRWIKWLIFKIFKHIESININNFDNVMVVSNALKDYVISEYIYDKNEIFVIPTALENKPIEKEEYKYNRGKYRKKYEVKNNEVLFVYSGGLSPWQNIELSVEMFNELKNKNKTTEFKMLILTFDLNKLKNMKLNLNKDIIIDSVSSELVGKVLCAGDFAFLLRDDLITNNVSFPNKFLEYVNSGVEVITTPYIHDVSKLINKYELGIIVEQPYTNVERLSEYVKKNENKKINFKLKNNILKEFSFETTLESIIR